MSRNNNYAIRYSLILVFSISLVTLVTWFAPSLDAAVMSMLFRIRGRLDVPRDVVILAIDDASLQRFGEFPWPRTIMTDVIDRLTQARVRSIGLDVLYSESKTPDEDRRLAAAIARNGRVVLPAQLYETASSPISIAWLKPIPEIANAAKALGQAHIAPDVNGMARTLQLQKADDRGEARWAFALEVIRVAERISETEIEEQDGALQFGRYRIPVLDGPPVNAPAGVTIIRPNEMIVNYAGPARTFLQYSIKDVLDGKLPPAELEGRIVLIGAVAATLGDSRVVPFMNYEGGRGLVGQEGGMEMPGIEIHANIINTIRGGLGLQRVPDWIGFLSALIVIVCSALTIRSLDGWRQVAVLFLILSAIVLGGFYVFRQLLIVPPLLPMMMGFFAVIPLLFNRQLNASRQLDLKLKALAASQEGFLLPEERGLPQDEDALLLDLPKSLAWKLRTVDELTLRLLARMSFIRRILTSMGEGVLVADLQGRIIYANDEALKLFGVAENELIGAYFTEFLIERGNIGEQALKQAVAGVFQCHNSQLEFEVSRPAPRYYSLLLSALTHVIEEKNGLAARPVSSSTEIRLPGLDPHVAGAIGVVALISDVTKRVELDRVKTETLQLVSHELRTPLTSIRGLSDVLLKFPVGVEESREMLATINSEALRLGETINRYLDLTRLESGGQALHPAPLSCAALIADSIRNHSVLAAERNIVLTSRVAENLPPLMADARLLMQAIGNLLSNAVKYSPPESEVIVQADADAASIFLRVIDQGYGIPAEATEKIFEKFYRLDRSVESQVVGTGLGLPLVKEIVEQHGGRISVESKVGKGSVFTITLPVNPSTRRR
jgi:signal transduction histidine kinase